MHCHQCHNVLPDNLKFCKHCGTPRQLMPEATPDAGNTKDVCGECGGLCKPGAKFCLQCGAPRTHAITETVAPAPAQAGTLVEQPPVQMPASGSEAAAALSSSGAPNFKPKILLGAAVIAVVVAISGWMLLKPSAQAVIAPDRLHVPNEGGPAEDDLAKAASIVGPQGDSATAISVETEVVELLPAPAVVSPDAGLATASSADTAVSLPASTPAQPPKPAVVKPAPKPTNTLDGLLD